MKADAKRIPKHRISPEKIPAALTARPQWVTWKTEERDGKRTKIPYNARTGHKAQANNATTWAPFGIVLSASRTGYDGAGYVFTAEDPFVGIDLDGCRNPETGEVAEWANAIIRSLATYGEVSPSGTGVKLFARGRLPDGARSRWKPKGAPAICDKPPGIEVYDRARYFCVTGWRLDGPSEPQDRQPQLEALLECCPKRENGHRESQNGHPPITAAPSIVDRARKYMQKVLPAIAGQFGHDATFAAACVLVLDFNLSPDEAMAIFVEWNQTCEPPWSEHDLRRKLEEANKQPGERGKKVANERGKAPKAKNGAAGARRNGAQLVWGVGASDATDVRISSNWTDASNGRRLALAHGQNLRWCDLWGSWLVWDGKRWVIDQQRLVDTKGKAVAAAIWQQFAELAQDLEPTTRGGLLRFATATSGARGIANMISLARSEPGIAIMPGRLDSDPWALNCENGTVDLRTGALRPHDRGDLLTKLCPVSFDPAATCPNWERFLAGIMAGHADLITFLQRAIGYSLTGTVTEQILFFLYGNGSNGKSTFLNSVQSMLGDDYACTAAPGLLLAKHGDSHPTELAALHGMRFVESIETEERRLNESLMKSLTGGDQITARRMRENFWQFQPTHKLWLCGNHKPTIRGQDWGTWRRIRLLPFTVTIVDQQQDKKLPEKLKAESPGILAWAVRGCLEWQRQGLGEPEAVKVATAEYRTEQDVVGAFLAEMTYEASTCRCKASTLYGAYVAWCKRTGEHAVNQRRFGAAITERGIERFTNNGVWYRDLGIIEGTDGTEGLSGF